MVCNAPLGLLPWEVQLVPTPSDQVLEDLCSFERSALAFSANFHDLLKKFPDKWVVLHDGVVVVSGDSRRYVLEEADKQQLRRSRINVRYVNTKPLMMIL
jgi:hypothetical protein